MIGVRESWEEPPKRKKVIWFKLADGERNRIAITSDQIVVYRAHFYNGRPYRCTGPENGCKLCALLGEIGTLNHLVNIYNYDKKENQVWGFRKRSFATLKEKKTNNNGFGEITLIIKREGDKKDNTTYVIDHSNRLPAEKAQEKLYEPIDLREIIPDIFENGENANKPEYKETPSKKEEHAQNIEDVNPSEEFYDDGDSGIDDLLN